jgi:DNA-directed RNA polymerase subunit RPC12/RpoP
MSAQVKEFGPACPHCGRRIPFSRYFAGRGTPFECPECGSRIVVPKASGLPVTSIFILIMVFIRGTPALKNNFWLVMLFFLVAGVLEYWFFTAVKDASAKTEAGS